jgi:hypothetical protein
MSVETDPGPSVRERNEPRCRRLLDTAQPLALDDLAWDAIAAHDLDPDVIHCLVYMRDVEGFTDRDLDGLTAHPTTLADPLIAEFLGLWRREEAGHTAALDRFLTAWDPAAAIVSPRQHPPQHRPGRLERVVARLGGPVGDVVAAAHMTWGAANELLTLNGYRLLARRCRHPVLGTLLERIAAQEARHYSFYLLQAQWRLQESRLARQSLRLVLERAWTPVGVGDGYKRPDEFGQVMAYLASGEDGATVIDRMDRRFAALPGFEGLNIFRTAATTFGDLHGPSSP